MTDHPQDCWNYRENEPDDWCAPASEQDVWEPCPRCGTRYDTCDCDMDDDPVLKRSADHYAELVASEQDDAGAELPIAKGLRAAATVLAAKAGSSPIVAQALEHVRDARTAYTGLRGELEALRTKNGRLRAENERLRAQVEHEGMEAYNYKWETESLRRRIAELVKALRELINEAPIVLDEDIGGCVHCGEAPTHEPDCPYLCARKLLDEQES